MGVTRFRHATGRSLSLFVSDQVEHREPERGPVRNASRTRKRQEPVPASLQVTGSFVFVGLAGFEPTTSCPPGSRPQN
jgi:hypothetical protein